MLRFASTGQSVSSERQNPCTTPGLNIEGRNNAKGGGAIWPSGDKAAKKLETLAFDDLLWPWPYASYHQVSGPCGAPHIQRISTSPRTVPLSRRATITKAGVAEQQLPRQEHNLPLSASDRSNACEKKRMTSKKYRLTYCSIQN